MVEIKVEAPLETMIIDGFWFPEIHLTWPGQHIHDLFSHVAYPIPRSLKVSWCQAHKLRTLTQQPYYTLLFTYFKHTLNPIQVLPEVNTLTNPTTIGTYHSPV